MTSKNLAENGEDEIGDLNISINCLKIEEGKFGRGDEEIKEDE